MQTKVAVCAAPSAGSIICAGGSVAGERSLPLRSFTGVGGAASAGAAAAGMAAAGADGLSISLIGYGNDVKSLETSSFAINLSSSAIVSSGGSSLLVTGFVVFGVVVGCARARGVDFLVIGDWMQMRPRRFNHEFSVP